jgi:hypothetical protein
VTSHDPLAAGGVEPGDYQNALDHADEIDIQLRRELVYLLRFWLDFWFWLGWRLVVLAARRQARIGGKPVMARRGAWSVEPLFD